VSSGSLQPILALLGHPVAGNPSQYMFEQALQRLGLDWRFLSLEVTPEDFADAVRGMRAMGFRGGLCADPHKQAVVAVAESATATARHVGAANCLFRGEAGLVAENTEGRGFVECLRRRTDPAGKRVVLLGAGRMARAIAIELAQFHPAEITVMDRDQQRGTDLVHLLTDTLGRQAALAVWEGVQRVPAETQVLIDATALSDRNPDDPIELELDGLATGAVVADVTFDPPRTWLLHEAARRDCTTIDGLEIFVEQAAINFHLWTGADSDREVLREAAEEFLEL
jgi:shikimate dehydrogenase